MEHNGFEEIDNWLDVQENDFWPENDSGLENFLEHGNDLEHGFAEAGIFEGSAASEEVRDAIENYAALTHEAIRDMPENEAEEYMEFAWGALISALAPVAISLAPAAIKAVGGLIKKISSRGGRQNAPNRSVRRPAPRRNTVATPPNRSRPPSPPRPTGVGATGQIPAVLGNLGSGVLRQLSTLLQNPNVINAITSVANTGINAAVSRNAQSPTARDTIEAISFLATEALNEIEGSEDAIPEYLYTENDELLADPYSPSERAATVVEYLGA